MSKKLEYPKGTNIVVSEIESILKTYGGSNWRKVTLQDLVNEVSDKMKAIIDESPGVYKVFAAKIQRGVKKKTDVMGVLEFLSEEMFKFSSDTSLD